jgi:phosphoglycerate dehydrogenase-like enzyme
MDVFEQLVRGRCDGETLFSHRTNVGLDVTVPEPLPFDHPLLTLENCTVFPHIGSGDSHGRHQMAQICVDNLLNYFSGKAMVHELKVESQ